jgi:uncharacterized membrane protein YdbT with pleckstrin-like domain
MTYVDENLLPGERVVYRAHLHRIIYAAPAAAALVAIAAFAVAYAREDAMWLVWVGALLAVVAAAGALASFIKSSTSEFAVTNRRVVIKTGVVRRHTLELLLQKVEGIGVDQTVIGRLLNIGTIVVIGTGGSKEQFANIADPLKFRHEVQAQTAGDFQPEEADASATSSEGPFCPACGTRNPPKASFCMRCGQRIPSL